jgi:hypothetical protein
MTLAVLAASTVVPVAEAGHGHGGGKGRRWKNSDYDCGPRVVERVYAQPRRHAEYRRHSSGGSTLAGFLGGVAVGALLSHAVKSSQAHAQVTYRYEDPYCHERFASLDACGSHMRDCDHPRVIRKIESSSGRCVDTYRWQRGGWDNSGDDWSDGGYDDRGYDDRGYDEGDSYDRGYDDEEYRN